MQNYRYLTKIISHMMICDVNHKRHYQRQYQRNTQYDSLFLSFSHSHALMAEIAYTSDPLQLYLGASIVSRILSVQFSHNYWSSNRIALIPELTMHSHSRGIGKGSNWLKGYNWIALWKYPWITKILKIVARKTIVSHLSWFACVRRKVWYGMSKIPSILVPGLPGSKWGQYR